MTTEKGILGIHVTKHTYEDFGVSTFEQYGVVGVLRSFCPKVYLAGWKAVFTYDAKDTKDSEDYCGRVIVSYEVVDSSANAEKYV